MQVTHEPWLVALSLIVAIQGAFVGLSLAVQVGRSTGLRRRFLLAGAAFSLAAALWSMHFVGLLAPRLPVPVDYLVFPTLLSFPVCVLVVGAAVFAVSAGPPTGVRLATAATAMGGGIASMHYVGMSALHASAHLQHEVFFVIASVVIAIAASGLALWLAGGRGGRPPLLLSAIALGAAISGMHYTAMAGLTVPSAGHPRIGAPTLSRKLLDIVLALVYFLGYAIFWDSFDRPANGRSFDSMRLGGRDRAAHTRRRGGTGRYPRPPNWGGLNGPLGGAGGSPRRFAQQLPVQRDGVTLCSGGDCGRGPRQCPLHLYL
jgi:NO-binding membrane sensor protein with MHYT domain